MKAIIYTEYGPPEVLKIKEVEKPYPKSDEVLIRIHAVSVNYGDMIARNFKNISTREFNMPLLIWILARFGFGFKNPKKKILGNTFAGEIETIGNDVKQFREGEQVFGYTGENMGGYAEYLCMPEKGIIAVKPSNMTYEEASIIPYGTIMALNLLKKANIQKGQKVLIIGASGGIGSAAVQLAKHHFGAEVTGVCSTASIEFVKISGADKVIDYKKEDFTKSTETYNLIFDILGKGSFSSYKPLLKYRGIYLLASFKAKKLLQMLWTSIAGGKKVICAIAIPKTEDLIFVKKLVEEGKLKSVIDRCFPLEQTAEAHKYIETGNNSGNVVIKVMIKNSDRHTWTGLRSILISTVLSFLVNTGFTQSIPPGSMYLRQAPPGNTPKIFPLSANHGSFTAERIAISNNGKDIYYSELKGLTLNQKS